MNQQVEVFKSFAACCYTFKCQKFPRKRVRHNLLNIVDCCVDIVSRNQQHQKQRQMSRKIKVLQTSQGGCSSG